MIKNEKQYLIAKAQLRKFESTLQEFGKTGYHALKVHPLFLKSEQDALRFQIGELQNQLEEYDKLKSGQLELSEADSLENLPKTLIKARIASGLNQRELAERLNLKEQQIQRYEATEYYSASFARLLEIAQALNLLEKGLKITKPESSFDSILSRLKKTGLDSDFIINRLASPCIRSFLETQKPRASECETVAMQISGKLSRIFGWAPETILGKSPLQVDLSIAGAASYKIPLGAEGNRLNAYIVYAHYLALLVLSASSRLGQSKIPSNPNEFREILQNRFGPINLRNTLEYVWSLGVPVLPLNDPGAFHGACWRIEGRNIIVLKQRTCSQARWLFDLLHETWHIAQNQDLNQFSLIESDPNSKERLESDDEEAASQFAGDVMLGGRAEELAKICVQKAQGNIRFLKSAVPYVAKQEGVSTDALANYMAFRLSLQGENWWGTAEKLQARDLDPLLIARDMFMKYISLESISSIDRNLLISALTDL